MKQSGLVRAVAFSALVGLSSACAYEPIVYRPYHPNQTQLTEEQIQEQPERQYTAKEFFHDAGHILLQSFAIGQAWIVPAILGAL